MITDKQLADLGLPTYENGYYQINEDLTVDVEETVRIEIGKNHFICQLNSIEEVKQFIEWANR